VQRADSTRALVVCTHGLEIEAREDVAIEHEERAGNVLLEVLDRAGVPSGVSSITVAQLSPKRLPSPKYEVIASREIARRAR